MFVCDNSLSPRTGGGSIHTSSWILVLESRLDPCLKFGLSNWVDTFLQLVPSKFDRNVVLLKCYFKCSYFELVP